MKPIAIGLVGLGGFGAYICHQLLTLTRENSDVVRLAGVFDRNVATADFIAAKGPGFAQNVEKVRRAGIPLHATYAALLASGIDALWLPVPIDLHRAYTEQALAAGIPVLVEKPAAGSIQDVLALIAARDQAFRAHPIPVAVGYQDLFTRAIWLLKQHLVNGDIGTLAAATLHAAWPRGERYFQRPWAGRLQRDGNWILDSVANNAMAHYLHLALFLLGSSLSESAAPICLEAELYRVNAIENYDTCSMRITVKTPQGTLPLVVALTHASQTRIDPQITIQGSHGQLHLDTASQSATLTRDGRPQHFPLDIDPHQAVLQPLATLIRASRNTVGGLPSIQPSADLPYATLEMSRSHALVISGASQAAKITTLHPPALQILLAAEADRLLANASDPRAYTGGGDVRFIQNIEQLIFQAIANRQTFHETRQAPWTTPPASISLENYSHFQGPPH